MQKIWNKVAVADFAFNGSSKRTGSFQTIQQRVQSLTQHGHVLSVFTWLTGAFLQINHARFQSSVMNSVRYKLCPIQSVLVHEVTVNVLPMARPAVYKSTDLAAV